MVGSRTVHMHACEYNAPFRDGKNAKLKIKCYLLYMAQLFINQSGCSYTRAKKGITIVRTRSRAIKKSDFPPGAQERTVHIYRLDRRVYCLSRILIVLPYGRCVLYCEYARVNYRMSTFMEWVSVTHKLGSLVLMMASCSRVSHLIHVWSKR